MLEIRLTESGDVVISGRFDASQATKAQSFLDTVLELRVLDLEGLEYISSAGLSVLLKTQKRLMQSGKGLQLVNLSRHIYDIFQYAGFDQFFDVQRPAQE